MKTELQGAYRIQVYEGNALVNDTGEFSNLITDQALQTGNPFSSGYLAVGLKTDPAGPSPTRQDTRLHNEVMQVPVTFESNTEIFLIGAERFTRKKVTGSFTGLSGEIIEVGFKRDNSPDSVLSRSLVRDGSGLQTVIPVEPIQTIKITYYVYIKVPVILDERTVVTPYGQALATVRTVPEMTRPQGVLAGDFDAPFGSNANGALLLLEDGGGQQSSATVFSSYDGSSQVSTVQVNFAAQVNNRYVIGIAGVDEQGKASKDLPRVVLDQPLLIPGDHDMTLTFEFAWGLPSD